LRRRARLPRARRDPPFGDRDAEAAEELLALVLVEVHGARRTLTKTTLAPPSGGDVNRSCDAVISFLRPMCAERRGLTVDCMQSTSGGTLMTPSPFVVETAGLTKRFGDRTVVRDVGLARRAGDRVGTYSLGMRQRLGIARLLLADPELLLLDEPMNGLDPAGIEEFRILIRSLVGEGRTVMLSSHLLDEVEKTVDALTIVGQGRVV